MAGDIRSEESQELFSSGCVPHSHITVAAGGE